MSRLATAGRFPPARPFHGPPRVHRAKGLVTVRIRLGTGTSSATLATLRRARTLCAAGSGGARPSFWSRGRLGSPLGGTLPQIGTSSRRGRLLSFMAQHGQTKPPIAMFGVPAARRLCSDVAAVVEAPGPSRLRRPGRTHRTAHQPMQHAAKTIETSNVLECVSELFRQWLQKRQLGAQGRRVDSVNPALGGPQRARRPPLFTDPRPNSGHLPRCECLGDPCPAGLAHPPSRRRSLGSVSTSRPPRRSRR